MGSFSIWHWLIVLVIVMLVFGTKKLRNIGADLGGAVRGLQGRHEGGRRQGRRRPAEPQQVTGKTIDVEVKEKTQSVEPVWLVSRLRRDPCGTRGRERTARG